MEEEAIVSSEVTILSEAGSHEPSVITSDQLTSDTSSSSSINASATSTTNTTEELTQSEEGSPTTSSQAHVVPDELKISRKRNHTHLVTSETPTTSKKISNEKPTTSNKNTCKAHIKPTISKEINVLLLGETGVGKSTFINSFANYMKHDDLHKAEGDKLSVLVPTNFNIFDKNFNKHNIKIGSNDDKNECLEIGQSGTQDVKTYIFNVVENNKNYKIRLIDTPGIGDPKGIKRDDANCEAILNYLGNIQEVHAICMLFNPSNSRVTVFLRYCIHQILSRLNKSASKNIAFLFTNTRGHNYTPGETYCCLETVIKELKVRSNTEIPLSVDNVFCFDNEAFRFLAAVRQGVELKDGIKEANVESWRYSSNEVWRLITYIIGDESHFSLSPHNPIQSISINKARKMIMRLTTPLAEIVQLITDNIYQLTKHTQDLSEKTHTIDELKQKMHIPVVNIRIKRLRQPVTVCTNAKCARIYKVADKNKYHYQQRCHNPCYLNNVTKETVGDPALTKCKCINSSSLKCKKCGCCYKVHMHIYYETQTYGDRVVDENVVRNITTEEEATREKQILINKMMDQKQEYEREHGFIVKATATFAQFLAHNAISPTNDSVGEYIEYLITREENNTTVYRSKETIDSLKKLLREYEEEKRVLKEALSLCTGDFSTLSPENIEKNIKDLYNLKHFGERIKELVTTQDTLIKREHSLTEVVVKDYYSLQKQKRQFPRRIFKKYNVIKNVSQTWFSFNRFRE